MKISLTDCPASLNFGVRGGALLLCCLALLSAGHAQDRGYSGGFKVATRAPNAYGTAGKLLPTRKIASVSQTIRASGDPADIYYPDLPARGAAPRRAFPPVILLQGAEVDRQYYSQFAQELARYGFVIIVPDHVSSIFGSGLFSEMNVITNALAHVQAETTDSHSPLFGIVDASRAGLSGHSFGSATALFALANFCTFPFCNPNEGFQLPPEIKAAALVAGNSGAFDLDTTGTPTALLIGDLDTGLANSRATFETLEPPRAFMLLNDANHYGLNDVDQPPNAQVREGEASQNTPQAITASRFAEWSGLFLRVYLYGDQQARRRIYKSGGDANTTVTGTEN
jgi:dienelactone hydrolase